ncbi:hypothetical protein [Commensalibacter papalotli (ex Botero et al. 2024)]|uniref:Uncharacterized protein n=1 Tax=Commensalibacter papalotli (ex Botero et al. 2024) TaxID=2972766 RepID=A0ABM9HT20_9PROT|nr:hypothetical protein [Commensalibacter papalotli (ex Botero et al. 2024)]CAI3953230.1 unnamed protein product [Commensalibacter papalotli (ex Botero et al. 2024)]CAI3953739.1 unnamed protein product [Commensalibacter papalotli (ex Botero et al. 2024)]
MIFIAVIIIVGLLTIPLAKKKAAKKGEEFNVKLHLLKLSGLIIGVVVASVVYESYFKKPQQSPSPKIFHLPSNVQNNLN